jgi:hypothetical protein
MVDAASPAMLYATYPGRSGRAVRSARWTPWATSAWCAIGHQGVRRPVAQAEVRQGVVDVRVAFPRRRRERRRYGGWRSGDRTLSCAGISSLEASRLKPARCEASSGSVWPSTLWMEFRAWRSQPARLITGTRVAGSLDR